MAPTRLKVNKTEPTKKGITTRSRNLGTADTSLKAIDEKIKRKANSPPKEKEIKRSAFGDITNAINKSVGVDLKQQPKHVTYHENCAPVFKFNPFKASNIKFPKVAINPTGPVAKTRQSQINKVEHSIGPKIKFPEIKPRPSVAPSRKKTLIKERDSSSKSIEHNADVLSVNSSKHKRSSVENKTLSDEMLKLNRCVVSLNKIEVDTGIKACVKVSKQVKVKSVVDTSTAASKTVKVVQLELNAEAKHVDVVTLRSDTLEITKKVKEVTLTSNSIETIDTLHENDKCLAEADQQPSLLNEDASGSSLYVSASEEISLEEYNSRTESSPAWREVCALNNSEFETLNDQKKKGFGTHNFFISIDDKRMTRSATKQAEQLDIQISTSVPVIRLPLGVEDFDEECQNDPCQASIYAMDIFNYLKEREASFRIDQNYMSRQPRLTPPMRTVLVDWLVEIQESFELNHETLYLAVKMVDLFLTKAMVEKDDLQLVGAAAAFVSAKFDERLPPVIDDFLYICDGAYTRNELLAMEIKLLKTLDFDLGIPLSYRFLRRYARCAKTSMPTLTLARYILELSLMDYTLISCSDSKMAAAALLLALKMRFISEWTPTLEYYSGYKLEDIKSLVYRLNEMLHKRKDRDSPSTVVNKYKHRDGRDPKPSLKGREFIKVFLQLLLTHHC
uniref:G2/mitotic-specific cyclin-B3 n=1 Tax=Timema cristinae TaxID=61476 RepID=A0A7R9GXZ9_TIMCR|nr:unnamed protein product [Timema cristinae]